MPTAVRAEDVLAKMAVDKKNVGGAKKIVLLRAIGDAGNGAESVDDAQILRVMAPGVEVVPSGPVHGTVRVPGSKSISNRVLLMAALGEGTCRVTGLLHSDDTKVMIRALTQLGVAPFEFADGGHTVVVQGAAGKLHASAQDVYLSNAGTASRFLATAVALARGGKTGEEVQRITLARCRRLIFFPAHPTAHLHHPARRAAVVTGNHRMQERPIADLVDALRGNGVEIEYQKDRGCPPLLITGDGFPGGRIELGASISSQYVSSILISAPYATKPVELKLVGTVVSLPYITMTIKLMAKFGVVVTQDADGVYHIPNDKGYVNPPVSSRAVRHSRAQRRSRDAICQPWINPCIGRHAHTRTRTRTHAHTCTRAHIHTRTRTQMHNAHTHIPPFQRSPCSPAHPDPGLRCRRRRRSLRLSPTPRRPVTRWPWQPSAAVRSPWQAWVPTVCRATPISALSSRKWAAASSEPRQPPRSTALRTAT